MNESQQFQPNPAIFGHVLTLLRASVFQNTIPESTAMCFTESMLEQIYALTKRHDLAHLGALALESLSLPDSDVLNRFHISKMRAIYRYVRMDFDYQQICNILENAHIPFLPLKGSVLREYYPEPWMRTSCDIDILVTPETLDSASSELISNGWTLRGKPHYHDISLYSPNGTHLELHFHLKENLSNIDPILETVWQHCSPAPGKNYEYRQTNEFFLFHHIAHLSYHFIAGGCGIRPFLDLQLLIQHMHYDDRKLQSLCTAAHLDIFFQRIMDLSSVWFANQPHSPLTRQMEDYILTGGTYGSLSNRVAMDQARAGNRWKNFLRRIFMPYHSMAIKYPILKTQKWLTPLFHFVRWFQLVTQKKFASSLRELGHISQTSDLQIRDADTLLTHLGLKR